MHELTQKVEALTEEARISRGRLELAKSDAMRSGSPEVLAALVAQKLEQAQRHVAPAEETVANEPKAPEKVDPVALAAANDVVDSAIQSGRWDRQHQLELSERLAALHSESEAREVAARVAAAINQGQLIPAAPDTREN
ncbi:MAG TPA: hypothetical protein VHB79_04395 [Polyangiaceae bacterium]|nr:hypothetical protein [Polyangiaceae bacterium]